VAARTRTPGVHSRGTVITRPRCRPDLLPQSYHSRSRFKPPKRKREDVDRRGSPRSEKGGKTLENSLWSESNKEEIGDRQQETDTWRSRNQTETHLSSLLRSDRKGGEKAAGGACHRTDLRDVSY